MQLAENVKKWSRWSLIYPVWAIILVLFVAFRLTSSGAVLSEATRLEVGSVPLLFRSFGGADTFPLLRDGSSAAAFILTTCKACQEATADIMNALDRAAADKSFVVFLDTDSASIQEYARAAGIPAHTIALPVNTRQIREVGLTVVPAIVLARRNHVWGWIGAPSWAQVLFARLKLRLSP